MCKMNLTRYEGNAKVSLDRKLKNDEGQNEKQLRTCILFDSVFASQMKLAKLPSIHCFVPFKKSDFG